MVVVFPTAFASVPPDSFSLVGACKLGVVDSTVGSKTVAIFEGLAVGGVWRLGL